MNSSDTYRDDLQISNMAGEMNRIYSIGWKYMRAKVLRK